MEAITTAGAKGSLAAACAPAGARRVVATWGCFAAVVAICAFSAVLAVDSVSVPRSASGFSLLVIPVAIVSAALGVLIRLRRPQNRVGWLLLANGLSLASLALAWPYAYYAGVSHLNSLPGASWAALWSEIGWPGIYVFLMAIAFVFPDGPCPRPVGAVWQRDGRLLRRAGVELRVASGGLRGAV